MKIQLFDTNLIRTYMESSSALEAGIEYVLHVNPSVSKVVARETAIQMAQEWCHEKWLRDSSVYTSERSVFGEFEKAVREKRYFYVKGMKTKEERAKEAHEQAQKWAKEHERVKKLKLYCTEHDLDFEKENKKAIAKLKVRHVVGMILGLLAFAGGGIFLIKAFITDGNGFLELGIAIGLFLLCMIPATIINPDLPDDYFSETK